MGDDGSLHEVKWSSACERDAGLYSKYISSVYLRECAQAIRVFGTTDVRVTAACGGLCSGVEGEERAGVGGTGSGVVRWEQGGGEPAGRGVAVLAVVGADARLSVVGGVVGGVGVDVATGGELLDVAGSCRRLGQENLAFGFESGEVDVGKTGGVAKGQRVCDVGGAVGVGGTAKEREEERSAVGSGSGSVEVSEKTLANRRRRHERKERKARRQHAQRFGSGCRVEPWRAGKREESSVPEWRRSARSGGGWESVQGRKVTGFFSESSEVVRERLRSTRAERLSVENELAVVRARHQIELERAKDMAQLKKCQEVRIMRQTEVNKVQVEKAFASLARTGNTPGGVGQVETVVSGSGSGASPVFSGAGSGSVSPNSSISLAEIHALQKECLSKQKDNEELQRQMNHLKFLDLEMYKRVGGGFKRAPTVDTGYTVDSEGQPIGEPPDTYWGGEIRADGKYHYVTDEPFHLYDY